jgi:hypothetical protein
MNSLAARRSGAFLHSKVSVGSHPWPRFQQTNPSHRDLVERFFNRLPQRKENRGLNSVDMKALISSPYHPLRYLAVVLAATFACGSAMAQWQWVDATGRKVFSDTAPPQNIPEKNILKRPGAKTLQSVQSAPAQAEPEAAAPVAQALGVDPKLEAKRKEAEKAEEAKRQAELERINKARAENCERAKRAIATLNSGVRIRTTNAQGEAEYMDDAAREAEVRRVEGIISKDCGPAPVPSAAAK